MIKTQKACVTQTDFEGVIVVNKPSGITSHDVVDRVRRKLKMRRVGHAGTLDPLATGVLLVLVGKATKLFEHCVAFDKAYRATLKLGETTTTADSQGQVLSQKSYDDITRDQLEDVFAGFKGEIEQVPPMVSAVKVNGKKLYELARRGIEVKREPRKIRIDTIDILRCDLPSVEFFVECSKGTYIRKLAEDIGENLGCGAHITQIERTQVGPFTLDEAVDLEEVNGGVIKPFRQE